MSIGWSKYKPIASLLGPILVLFSIIFLHQYRNDIKGALFVDVAKLKKTQGVVTFSRVKRVTGKSSSYRYLITYEYTVDGRKHESSQITFASKVGDRRRDFAQAYVDKYPTGEPVVVYYKVADPSFSVLEPNQKGTTIYLLIVLVVTLLSSLAVTYWAYDLHKKFGQQTA